MNKELKKANAEDVKPELPVEKKKWKINEFKNELLRLNQEGRAAVTQHKELMPMSHNGKKNKRKGIHAFGTAYDSCNICKIIIDSHNTIMTMQSDAFGMTGIPYDNLMAAIKITEGLLRMERN